MSFDQALQSLKAAADPSRLRLLALLTSGETTVGELQEILGQSQPRVSRHLKLLVDAGLVTRFRDGHWVYYRIADAPAAANLVEQIVNLAGRDAQVLRNDFRGLARVKRERERSVFNKAAARPWSAAARPDPASIVEALDDAVGQTTFGDVLDIGSGAGSLAGLLGRRARSIVGVDTSRSMRLLARSRLHRSGLANCTIRDADLHDLPFADGGFDLVVLDEVLGRSDDPLAGLREARRVLRPTGHLVILDRIHPVARRLAPSRQSDGLYENQLLTLLTGLACRVTHRVWFPGRTLEYALFTAAPVRSEMRTGTYA